jgi:hypothetical protein
MVLCVIKQRANEKMKVYYEQILKLMNCFQHKANDSMFSIFFHARLVPFL